MSKSSGGKGGRGGRSGGEGFTDATKEQLAENFEEWGKDLTDAERLAILEYQDQAFRFANEVDRRGITEESAKTRYGYSFGTQQQWDEYNRITEKMNSAIEKSPGLDKNTLLYRSVYPGENGGKAYIESLQPGKIITDNAYGSTTTAKGRDIYKGTIGHARVVIQAPKGTKGAHVPSVPSSHKGKNQREQEFILPKGSRYRVISRVTEKDGSITVIVELV